MPDSSFPFLTYNCLKFPDCGWIAINHVPESVVSRDVHDVTVEVEYYWINPGRDGWILLRSNGPDGVEQYAGNDINTHKEFFRANEWATWTLRLQNTYFGTRADGTDLFLFFGADPDDVCYIRAVKVYQTATPDNFAVFGAEQLQSAAGLELDTQFRDRSYVAFDLHTTPGTPGLTRWNSGVEVIFGQTGGRVTIDGEPLTYHAGDILFVNPEQVRTADAAIAGSCYYMVFDLATLDSSLQHPILRDLRTKKTRFCNRVAVDHPAHPALAALCRALIAAYSSHSEYKELKIRSLLLSLLYECGEAGLIVEADPADSRKMEYIRRALLYMEQHFAAPLTVGEIADHVHLSEAYFSRRFKVCVGTSPLEYVNTVRVKRAAALLLAGVSVTDTAMEVGVPNVGHFIRLFKKHYSITPYQWQKQQGRALKKP